MTDIGEAIANLVMSSDDEDCWFCKQKPEEEGLQNKLHEDPDSIGTPENDITNDSSALGQALGYRPTWKITEPTLNESVDVTPAAHHLIPGNASYKHAASLRKFVERAKGVIKDDIGYDINSRENGVWLPGNYGVNKNSKFKQNWRSYDHKDDYARAAMERARAQFHDSHPDYSENVKRTLTEIGNKIVANHPQTCPVCGKEISDKARPPYGLVGRLHAVSRNHRRFVTGPRRKWPVESGYYTSKRSILAKT